MTLTCRPARPLRSLLGITAVPLLLVLGAAACGDDDDDAVSSQETEAPAGPTTTDAAPTDDYGAGGKASEGGAAVTISGFTFSEATVAPGAEVAVTNEDDVPHTATADDDSFDSGRLDGGGSGTLTAPSEPGSYAFHCEVHPDMQGTLTVEA
jgi:plastocyanin